jgi:hypothetical protein
VVDVILLLNECSLRTFAATGRTKQYNIKHNFGCSFINLTEAKITKSYRNMYLGAEDFMRKIVHN